jgi:hypothetical protein
LGAKGERTVLIRDRKTEEVQVHQVIDPKMMAIGLEQYRKVTGLEQKPTLAMVTIVGSGSTVG